jgi:hypothetical protein
MDPHQYVKKEWIVSPVARRVYRTCAVVSLTLYASMVALALKGPLPGLKQLLFLGALATGVNGCGMEVFLFRFDDSPAWRQVLWFFLMIFVPLGPALYCFRVYSRSAAVQAACATRSDASLTGMKS